MSDLQRREIIRSRGSAAPPVQGVRWLLLSLARGNAGGTDGGGRASHDLCCLGLKPESAIIAVVPVLHEIIPGGRSRVWLCEPDATMGSTSGENPQGTSRSVPASPPQRYSPSPSCLCLPDDVLASCHFVITTAHWARCIMRVRGGSIDNADIFNVKLAAAMELAL
jgi:hypothetical protein